jgi:putative hemolysin
MPFNWVRAEETPTEVLSGLADFPGLAAKFAPVDKVRELYRRVRQSPEGFRLERLLAEMRIDLRVDVADQSRLPCSGPVVVVANHPYGMLDGAILAVLLTRIRPDVKILTNLMLGDVPELQQHCIFVDSGHPRRSPGTNPRALRRAMSHLRQGGMLVVFPSDDVSHWQMPAAEIADPAWNDTALRLIRRTGASALPVYLCGHFQFLSMVHGKLRSAFLLQEFLQQEGKHVEVRVGSQIPADSIATIADDHEATEYLRWRTYLLAKRSKSEVPWPAVLRTKFANKNQEPIAEAVPAELLAEEIGALPPSQRLAANGGLSVYLASANEAPQLLHEVGRLREITFRRAGEGTGKSLDLDRFDDDYSHILLWNEAKCELVGAYRAGNTTEIIAERGISGLYTNTLFRYDERIFQKLGPAWELGRSFVRPEYQRQYAPLLLLWKGIARLIAMRPEIPVLFGAVSISNDYNDASREMIYRFFEARMQDDELAGLIEPRRPFRPVRLRRWDCRSMSRALHDLDELSQPITDVETDGKGLPILLRQYAKIGGKLLGFNVDRKFSNVLDGLVVVDLRQTEQAVLERYMGRESAAAFRKIHSNPMLH